MNHDIKGVGWLVSDVITAAVLVGVITASALGWV